MNAKDAASLLKSKLESPSFIKAVGKTTAEAIRTLLQAYECSVVLSKSEVMRLLNDYYIFESRIKSLVEFYEKLTGGALSALAKLTFGEEVDLPEADYKALLRELEVYRSALFKLGELLREAERNCPDYNRKPRPSRRGEGHSSTNSNA
ncbi:hypothetical protein [Thermoproteus tenax]|uniref:Uncharacterized protein n=1 Tax=Thermoproteus tenax (strain ATCC 35583 / DSM 2078 / JCM 9277 / NBRC 100435 / Kra 1) TaxID=768679 RepID=G4RNX3_THETK|nr:hypothetical protein [Thermoproteus tenax]CCC81267.1 hypothetical protein TTX_0607 [Thermoproteus tenax Kra 1]